MKDDQIESCAEMDPDSAEVSALLQKVAAQTRLDPLFQTELESRLKAAYKSKGTDLMTGLRKLAPTLAWILALIAFAFVLACKGGFKGIAGG